jgi:chromosome segregation ATPase
MVTKAAENKKLIIELKVETTSLKLAITDKDKLINKLDTEVRHIENMLGQAKRDLDFEKETTSKTKQKLARALGYIDRINEGVQGTFCKDSFGTITEHPVGPKLYKDLDS